LACLIACLWLPCCAYIDIIFLIDMNRGMSWCYCNLLVYLHFSSIHEFVPPKCRTSRL
jgi:hypothetical protein